ncbi:hypothetical protein ACRALDRAFT_1078289 [Sodiomyces alcalophilus JCM 7366]|uniref:uncharacterized protein n=1 Tax=Sodiomyces alcalophilus JCM 7366 TaxID=591952 RepID=UPI0039B56668
MCEWRVIHYADCNHNFAQSINRCDAARARPNQQTCLPASGRERDLPRSVDIQDQNTPGKCPPCLGISPPSSEHSQ